MRGRSWQQSLTTTSLNPSHSFAICKSYLIGVSRTNLAQNVQAFNYDATYLVSMAGDPLSFFFICLYLRLRKFLLSGIFVKTWKFCFKTSTFYLQSATLAPPIWSVTLVTPFFFFLFERDLTKDIFCQV